MGDFGGGQSNTGIGKRGEPEVAGGLDPKNLRRWAIWVLLQKQISLFSVHYTLLNQFSVLRSVCVLGPLGIKLKFGHSGIGQRNNL